MNSFLWIILSSIVLAVISLVGALTLFLDDRKFQNILVSLVAFSAGALLGGAFFHLIPESVNDLSNSIVLYVLIIVGFLVFFVLEQFIHFHHCRKEGPKHIESYSYLSLIADNLHNLIDGITIASAFIININLGFATFLAILLHEIPHELGNFSILVHGGFKKKTALLYNFLSSISFLVGGVVTYFISSKINVQYLVPFAAGTFIYIAASDLVPEIHKDCHLLKRNFIHFFAFVFGILLLFLAKVYYGG